MLSEELNGFVEGNNVILYTTPEIAKEDLYITKADMSLKSISAICVDVLGNLDRIFCKTAKLAQITRINSRAIASAGALTRQSRSESPYQKYHDPNHTISILEFVALSGRAL